MSRGLRYKAGDRRRRLGVFGARCGVVRGNPPLGIRRASSNREGFMATKNVGSVHCLDLPFQCKKKSLSLNFCMLAALVDHRQKFPEMHAPHVLLHLNENNFRSLWVDPCLGRLLLPLLKRIESLQEACLERLLSPSGLNGRAVRAAVWSGAHSHILPLDTPSHGTPTQTWRH